MRIRYYERWLEEENTDTLQGAVTSSLQEPRGIEANIYQLQEAVGTIVEILTEKNVITLEEAVTDFVDVEMYENVRREDELPKSSDSGTVEEKPDIPSTVDGIPEEEV